MDPRTRQLLEGPIAPTLLRLAAPNLLLTLVQASIGLVETYFIGKLGTDALAGVALVFPVFMLMQMMSAGAITAYATNKASLFEMSEKLPGSRVLEGRWGVERFAIAMPKGRDQAMAFVRQFIHDVKSEGLINAAAARAGLRGAATPSSD